MFQIRKKKINKKGKLTFLINATYEIICLGYKIDPYIVAASVGGSWFSSRIWHSVYVFKPSTGVAFLYHIYWSSELLSARHTDLFIIPT